MLFVSSCGITLSLDREFTRENENYNSLLWREFYYWKKNNLDHDLFDRKRIINSLLWCEFIIESF